jgi:serine protease Do
MVVSIQTMIKVGRRNRTRVSSQGSGFVYRSNGLIVTNHHVVEGSDRIDVILWDGRRVEAELVQFDPRSDLAVLQIEARNLRVAPLADLSEVRQGQWAFTVGNPLGMANEDGVTSFAPGVVSAMGKSLQGSFEVEDKDRFYGNLIQTNASINPGNSGGPLFDIRGRVIGVSTAMKAGSGFNEGMGFAIPITRRTRRILEQLAEGEVVRYGYLGVSIVQVDRTAARRMGSPTGRGALVTGLSGGSAESPAAKAGLRTGDLITSFDGVSVRDRDHLIRLVGETPVGSAAELEYYRERRAHRTRVQLVERMETVAARVNTGDGEPVLRPFEWKGLTLVEPTDLFLQANGVDRADAGLYVLDVPRSTEFFRAGLREDTLIIRVNGRRVRSTDEFLKAARQGRNRVRIELNNGQEIQVEIDT